MKLSPLLWALLALAACTPEKTPAPTLKESSMEQQDRLHRAEDIHNQATIIRANKQRADSLEESNARLRVIQAEQNRTNLRMEKIQQEGYWRGAAR